MLIKDDQQKPKIAIILGQETLHVYGALFTHLQKNFIVKLIAMDQLLTESQPKYSFPVFLVSNSNQMPGFVQNLEEFIANSDLVIGVEPFRLATFQASKTAKKLDLPFIVLMSKAIPELAAGAKNLRAVEFDNIASCDHLFTASPELSIYAKKLGASEQKLSLCRPPINFMEETRRKSLREKFRQHVHIPLNHFVTLVTTSFTAINELKLIIEGIGKLKKSEAIFEDFSRCKWIFAGSGPLEKEVKYLCVDHDVGQNVLFLHQDTSPFYEDLLAAVDIQLFMEDEEADSIPDPSPMLRAMGAGVCPVSGVKDLVELYVRQFASTTQRWNFCHEWLEKMKETEKQNTEEVLGKFSKIIHTLTGQQQERPSVLREIQDFVTSFNETLPTLVEVSAVENLLLQVEHFLLVCPHQKFFETELYVIKSILLQKLNRDEEAFVALQNAIQRNPQHPQALRALGFLAWKSHSHEEALLFFKRSMSVEPNHGESALGMGLVFHRIKMFRQAQGWLLKAVLRDGEKSKGFPLLLQTCLEAEDRNFSRIILNKLSDYFGSLPLLEQTKNIFESRDVQDEEPLVSG